MQSLHDSDLPSGERPFYTVVAWNVSRTRRSIFKNCADKDLAHRLADELRRYGIDALVHAVGEP